MSISTQTLLCPRKVKVCPCASQSAALSQAPWEDRHSFSAWTVHWCTDLFYRVVILQHIPHRKTQNSYELQIKQTTKTLCGEQVTFLAPGRVQATCPLFCHGAGGSSQCKAGDMLTRVTHDCTEHGPVVFLAWVSQG